MGTWVAKARQSKNCLHLGLGVKEKVEARRNLENRDLVGYHLKSNPSTFNSKPQTFNFKIEFPKFKNENHKYTFQSLQTCPSGS